MSADEDMQTFNFQNPLTYQASTMKHPDLPTYVIALTGDDAEGFLKP